MAVTVGSSECFSPKRQQEFDSHSYSAQITMGKVAIWGPHCSTRFRYLSLWISTAVTMASETNEKLLGPLKIPKTLVYIWSEQHSDYSKYEKIRPSCVKWKSIVLVKEERNILHTIKRRKTNWIVHIFRSNCIIKHVIEEKVKGKMRKKT
jgi:hypothetical protein